MMRRNRIKQDPGLANECVIVPSMYMGVDFCDIPANIDPNAVLPTPDLMIRIV